MSTNYKTSGRTIKHANAAAVESGDPVAIGSLLGVARGKYAANETGIYAVEGIHTLPKANAALAIGARVHFDVSEGRMTGGATVAGDLENAAVVAEAAAAGTTTVAVRLSPGSGTVKA